MITQTSVPLSGTRFAQSQLQLSAHNTANTLTDSFVTQRARGVEALSGVRMVVDQPAPDEPNMADSLPGPQNKVNLVEETANRVAALRSFQTNADVIGTQDRMTRSLLDMTA